MTAVEILAGAKAYESVHLSSAWLEPLWGRCYTFLQPIRTLDVPTPWQNGCLREESFLSHHAGAAFLGRSEVARKVEAKT